MFAMMDEVPPREALDSEMTGHQNSYYSLEKIDAELLLS